MMLPAMALIIAGAPKAGTTTLHDALKYHESLLMPTVKEPSFFNEDDNYKWGVDYYFRRYYPQLMDDSILVDCSPLYAKSKNAVLRIKQTFGSRVKVVLILRDPVDRAYSHYLHNRRDVIYDKEVTFEEALDLKNEEYDESDCVRYSKYHEMISIWVETFGKNNVLLLMFESDIVGDLQAGVDKVCDFAGISRIKVGKQIESNVAKQSKTGFYFLRKIFFSDSAVKRIVKPLIPPLYRHRFRLLFNKLTSTDIKEKKIIDKAMKADIYNKYFKKDMQDLKKDYDIDYGTQGKL